MQIFSILVVFAYICGSIGFFIYMFLQKNYFYTISKFITSFGLIIHTMILFYCIFFYKNYPVNSLGTILSITSWSIIIVFIAVQCKYPLKLLSIYAPPIGAILIVLSFILSKNLLSDPVVFKSIWLGSHIFAIFLGESSFALACGSGILYIIQENSIKKKRRGFFFNRLPSLELVDNTGYSCVLLGSVFITVGLMTGSIYAKMVWNHFWSWDPKEIWSIITWFFYVTLIYKRLFLGWRGRKFAIMTIVGFIVILFTFFGVNFLLLCHHSTFISI